MLLLLLYQKKGEQTNVMKDKSTLEKGYFNPARRVAKGQVYGAIEAAKRPKSEKVMGRREQFKEYLREKGMLKDGHKD
jgi:hypothetical protein